MFADEVFVFTPKGDVISLPSGATPIDFAYAIHSAVGNKMVGAKVNAKMVSIDYTLQSGDIVDIITSNTSTGPKRDWMQIVKTNSAKTKIKQWFKKERREENIAEGKAVLERELKSEFLWELFNQPDFLPVLLRRFDFASLDELYASVGYGGITASRIVARVREEQAALQKLQSPQLQTTRTRNSKRSKSGVVVEGLDNCLVKFAKCCTPVPGDEIIGFVTRGNGVSIHRKDCINVKASINKDYEYGRWIKVAWDDIRDRKYVTSIRITAKTRLGILADVVTVFNNMKIGVTELNVRDMPDGKTVFFTSLEVFDTSQLQELITRLKRNHDIYDVSRAMSGKEDI